ncbi:hypothetical protein [Nonomuraea sp. NPDC050783]|uniref:hypothetical protein n=1 Tax=Nonomuraea sp. NPDC050783 TaxID=3154634 RepID=UPI0034655054
MSTFMARANTFARDPVIVMIGALPLDQDLAPQTGPMIHETLPMSAVPCEKMRSIVLLSVIVFGRFARVRTPCGQGGDHMIRKDTGWT